MVAKNLNKKQEEAVNYGVGPLMIVAGAGSGKTKTLTSRIIKLIQDGIPPNKILAITFTNKAAQEMRSRIQNAGKNSKLEIRNLFIGTFHSFGARILRKEARRFKRTPNFTIFDDNDSLSLVKKIAKQFNLASKYKPPLLRYKISRIKNELAKDNDETAQSVFNEYEKLLAKNNAFDFDDLIEKPVALLTRDAEILKKYQKKFSHILVDEFQDVNTAQYQLVKLLAKEHSNISAVGDDAQSIYGWRYADFRNFLNFDKDWPKTKVILLEENYRSTANIIAAANQVIKNNNFQKQKDLWTKNSTGELITVLATNNESEEADWVADKIESVKNDGADISQTAILYRTNAQSRAIEQALIGRQIPYVIFGGLKFYERKEIKDLLAGLRVAFNPKDEVGLERIGKNFSKAKGSYLIEQLPRLAKELSVVQLVNFIINNTNYLEYLENRFKNFEDRLENVKELVRFAETFTNKTNALREFLEKVSLTQSQDNSTEENCVKLMTIHLSKGLEFDTVFVAGCTDGILPHEKSYANKESLEEERRLIYVAMTRAKKRLFLSFAGIPSRFLYEIPPELVEFSALRKNQTDYLPDEEEGWITYD